MFSEFLDAQIYTLTTAFTHLLRQIATYYYPWNHTGQAATYISTTDR